MAETASEEKTHHGATVEALKSILLACSDEELVGVANEVVLVQWRRLRSHPHETQAAEPKAERDPGRPAVPIGDVMCRMTNFEIEALITAARDIQRQRQQLWPEWRGRL